MFVDKLRHIQQFQNNMSPERVGSPLGLEPRELALALQTAVPPFKLVRLQLNTTQQQQSTTTITSTPEKKQKLSPGHQDQDDDLTSLTWLQDNNLLKGMNLNCVKAEADEMQQVATANSLPSEMIIRGSPASTPQSQQTNYSVDQSPTSDYMDESSVSEPTDSSSSSLNSPVPYSYNNNNNNNITNNNNNNNTNNSTSTTPSKSNKHPHNVRYDPMIHTFSKPPYSFSCLIFMAIEDSPQKALPVKDIYAWILDHFPYFKNAPTGWKNSVRHNLSLNKCFQKVEKSPNLGKGSLWMVDQQYRPNLLQALTRSPFHPYSTLDPATFRSTTSRTSSPFVQQMIDNTKTSTRLPNPELFPYLSRRLAASEAVKQDVKVEPQVKQEQHLQQSEDDEDAESSLDDVHAATAILYLKHGSKMIIPEHNGSVRLRDQQQIPTEMVQVITRSPSEDHTYSSATTNNNGTTHHTMIIKQEDRDEHDGGLRSASPRAPSPDEAFESDDDSVHSRLNYSSIDLEEQRRIEEGADALLNLAGISTLRNSNNETYHHHTTLRRSRKRGYNDDEDEENDDENIDENEDNHSLRSSPEIVREQQQQQRFRPRMLRTKRKLNVTDTEHTNGNNLHQSKRSKHVNNNNNNNIDSKMAAKLTSARKNGDWGVQKYNRNSDDQILSHR
ncbi:forkhead box protein N2 isoform X2 [Chrysoperla carnea]|uniref:forkhead box protein N2 isoform X2 n=1 Tax=Chrysoperla carnea TaxID=189513 RepID=UPI001D06A2CF|nr:forkhead box protein N2 isoform X2 [Chrysoperla carnea]